MRNTLRPWSPTTQSALLELPLQAVELRYHVELITPMMGGGVKAGEPDLAQPFRAKSIKGHLRWWWRTLVRSGDLPWSSSDLLTPEALRDQERKVWGGVGEPRPVASSVAVRVENVACVNKRPYQLMHQDGKWFIDNCFAGLDYAYFSAQKQSADDVGKARDPLHLVEAGASFDLVLTVRHAHCIEQVRKAVLAWATFGGVGSRTRRGAGAVKVVEASSRELLSDLWDFQCTEAVVRTVERPVNRSAISALRVAIGLLRDFRQREGLGRGFPAAGSGNRPGRSHWPEPDAIRRLTGKRFDDIRSTWFNPRTRLEEIEKRDHSPAHEAGNFVPRAAFGMPLTIRFVRTQAATGSDKDQRDPMARNILPARGEQRMASPLIIRPVAVMVNGQVEYVPVAAMLLVNELAELKTVELTPGFKGAEKHTLPTWDATWLPGSKAGSVLPLEHFACAQGKDGPFVDPKNAVEAFMNYFANVK